ncbi:hypothetical protein U9M48_030991 [Paspalum notatum var. saurae]|uniref:Uncharacterized protein n=1 Tax=Paspalum notatum var. saurae TaxID=547442 RepID=A0AAQ3U1W5_PASNO
MSNPNRKKFISDYERQLKKACQTKQSEARSKKDVPQLGTQKQQAQRLKSREEIQLEQFLAEAGLTAEQALHGAEASIYTWTTTGEARVAEGPANTDAVMIGVLIQHEHFFRERYVMWLDFRDIYEIYHQDTLDLSLVSCWILMEIQRCRNHGVWEVGFVDPVVVNQNVIKKWRGQCAQQGDGSNLCGYYVCEFMHTFIGQNSVKKDIEVGV